MAGFAGEIWWFGDVSVDSVPLKLVFIGNGSEGLALS